MVSSLTSGVSGIQQFQNQLDVIGNNIANSDTFGFKSGRADFEDAFSQSLLTNGANNPNQIGSGVGTGAVLTNYNQGTVTATGVPTDVAIQGQGYFLVKDPVSGNTFATRAGDFHQDGSGYLVTNDGYRVQGYNDSGLSTIGDIKIDDSGKPDGDTSSMSSFFVDSNGKVQVKLESGNSFTRAQILLQNFQDPGSLVKEGSNLYSNLSAAGPLAQLAPPDTNGVGSVLGGHLESSNVDMAGEMTNLINTQRAFQASARIITTTDEMLQEVVNLKH